MVTIFSAAVFLGAFATSGLTIAGMVGPQWRRIARLAAGHVEPTFAPLTTLVQAERRIAVRRWANATPTPARRRAAA